MIIKSIYLKNVAGVFNGMGLEKIFIDFDNENNINLLCGTNGSGKSTIEKALNPFFTETIRKDKKGSKVIIFKKKKYTIEIEHIATPTKTGHSIKSYMRKITKNETIDLNENGNQSSFLKAVEDELDITPDKIKLLSLGTDMSTITDMPPTQRKNFISNFTQDADIYLSKLNKVNNDAKVLNGLLKNCALTLKNLGSKDEISHMMNNINVRLDKLNEDRNEYTREMAVLTDKINNLNDISKEDGEKYIAIRNTVKQITDSINSVTNLSIKEIGDYITNINYKKSLLESEKSKYVLLRKTLNEKFVDKKEILDNYILERDVLASNMKENKNTEQLISLRNTAIENIEKTKTNYNKFIDIIKGNENVIDIFYNEYDSAKIEIDNIISEISDVTKFDISIEAIDKTLMDIKKVNKEYTDKVVEIAARMKFLHNKIEDCKSLPKAPANCTISDCPYLSKIREHQIFIDEKDKLYEEYIDLNKTIESNETDIADLLSLLKIKNRIEKFKKFIQGIDNRILEYVDLCVIDEYKIKLNMDRILELKDAVNEIKIYERAKETLEIVDKDIDNMNRMRTLEYNISELNKTVVDIQNNIAEISNTINTKNNELQIIDDELFTLSKYEDIVDKYGDSLPDIVEKANTYAKNIFLIDEMKRRRLAIENGYKSISKSISDLEKEKEELSYRLTSIDKNILQKQLLETYFMDNKMVKEALGTKKGIPLILVNKYLQKTRMFANQIIKEAFDGELILEEFDISPTEFNIPLTKKNGEGIPDISKASSGEKAIATLAISLAIYKQNKTKYNILLLDELDGPLDSGKRRKFIKLIQDQMEELKIDQLFNITHNNLFNDIPANLIMLKGAEVDILVGKEIIYKFE